MAKEAYDLNYFMPRHKAKAPSKRPVLRVQKNEKKQRRRKVWRAVKMFCATAVMLFLVCGVLYTQSTVAELQNSIGVANKDLAQENTERRNLTAQLDSKVNLKTVEQQAAMLGLIKMENSQKTYIRSQQENLIEVRTGKLDELLENTRNKMLNMMDYLNP